MGNDTDLRRQVIYGVLSLVLGLLATWLARYLTNRLLGEQSPGEIASSS